MPSPRDFPPLSLCKPCKRLFVNCEDPDPNNSRTIQNQAWCWDLEDPEHEGYTFTRTRIDLERGAFEGCEFCESILSPDAKYTAGQNNGEAGGDEYEESSSNDGGGDDACDESEGADHDTDNDSPCSSCYEGSNGTDGSVRLYRRYRYDDCIRPTWFPPEDEEMKICMSYNVMINTLSLYVVDITDYEGAPSSCTWGLFTTEDDPASQLVHSRAVLTEVGSPESFALAREWLCECSSNHAECPADKPAKLPKRLVEVSAPDEPQSARLRSTQGQEGSYCALSYCWGGPQLAATTIERFGSYVEALPYDEMPKTIQDAFEVTRQLGLRYIWIDSLCIIQDDPEDVQSEMTQMLQIYRNSQFTISAASADNCNAGFLQPLNPHSQEDAFFLPLRVDEDTMGSILIAKDKSSWSGMDEDQKPINKRAWTLQESLLTPRLLMFTGLNMIWRCQREFQPDFVETVGLSLERNRTDPNHLNNHPWSRAASSWGYSFSKITNFEDLSLFREESSKGRSTSGGDRGHSLTYETTSDKDRDGSSTRETAFDRNFSDRMWSDWKSIVKEYSNRELTKQSDKLPALSALAEVFNGRIQSHYLAGLWGRYLIRDLMWSTGVADISFYPEDSESGSPSWSWASVKSKIRFHDSGDDMLARADILDCRVTLASDTAPFGAVAGGELDVRGHLKEVQLDREGYFEAGDDWVIIHSDGESRLSRAFDVAGETQTLQAWCLTLGATISTMNRCGESRLWESLSLLLARAPSNPEHYVRIGFVQCGPSAAPFWWEDCDPTTVTIV